MALIYIPCIICQKRVAKAISGCNRSANSHFLSETRHHPKLIDMKILQILQHFDIFTHSAESKQHFQNNCQFLKTDFDLNC